MSLSEQTKEILENFESSPSDKIVAILEQIRSEMKSQHTQEYLSGKIDGVKKAKSEEEKKKLCKNLKPYLDWQIQGN